VMVGRLLVMVVCFIFIYNRAELLGLGLNVVFSL
jgi:hypothetical protein